MLTRYIKKLVFSPPLGVRFITGSSAQLSNFKPNVSHRHTPDNNEIALFDFTPENYKRVNAILGRYPDNYKMAAMIPLLDLAQRQKVAKITGSDDMDAYEVATFYTMFNRTKVGKYFIQLCGTTPCMVCGSEEIKKTIEDYLEIEEGETTADGMFTLREVECLGSCANAPMVQLNDDYYECLTPATTIELLKACQAGKPPPMGKWGSLPMNGQVSCEGPLGKTSLFETPPGPGAHMRPDSDLTPKLERLVAGVSLLSIIPICARWQINHSNRGVLTGQENGDLRVTLESRSPPDSNPSAE